MVASFLRRSLVLVALCAFGASHAQTPPRGLQPLPDIPPPPKLSNAPVQDDEENPSITIRQGEGGAKVEEFRTKGGKLYAVRVTPTAGKPYVLIDPDGSGRMINPAETNAGEINGGVHPAQWTLFEF